jgi:hypothetical protein
LGQKGAHPSTQQRVQDLATRFAQVNEAIRHLVEPCTETQWQTPCVAEGWAVGVTVYHIAAGYDQEGWVAALIRAVLAGQARPPHPADLHPERDYNTWQAQQAAACTPEETLRLLQHNEAAVLQLVEGLQDEDLDKVAPTSSGRTPISLQAILEHILINHAHEHLKSLQATLEAR